MRELQMTEEETARYDGGDDVAVITELVTRALEMTRENGEHVQILTNDGRSVAIINPL